MGKLFATKTLIFLVIFYDLEIPMLKPLKSLQPTYSSTTFCFWYPQQLIMVVLDMRRLSKECTYFCWFQANIYFRQCPYTGLRECWTLIFLNNEECVVDFMFLMVWKVIEVDTMQNYILRGQMVYKSVGPFQIYCYLQLFLKNLKKFTLFRNNIKNMKFCNVKCTKEIFRSSYFLLYSCYIVIELYLKHCI